MKAIIIFCLIFLTTSSKGAKILAVFPVPVTSHYILGNSLLRGLAEAGHDVTMISPFRESNPPKNGSYRDIVLDELIGDEFSQEHAKFSIAERNPFYFIPKMFTALGTLTEKALNNSNVQKLIKSEEKFDAVIVGQFGNEAMKAFATHFDAHLIVFSSVGSNSMLNHLVGNPSLPSFAPEVLASFPPRMSFFQRLFNTLVKFVFTFVNNFIIYPQQNELIRKHFPKPVDINDIIYNTSLVLLNSHVSIASPQPLVPAMVDIGGFHVKPPKKLPEDLQVFLDNAKDGVIYFSMGSILKSKNLPADKRDTFLKAFGKLKQKVLWKWEDDVLPGQPANVKLGKWLPQQDILAHPNVKVFITHGGLLSNTETIYHGVPIIAIPVLGDQKMNAYTAERGGYGIVLPYTELSEETLSSKLKEILTNPKYRDEAQKRSRIMHDRQVSPLDNAVYWVEYVIRHNGAKHLRVPYLDLKWYQYYLLDVFAFILAVLVGIYIFLKRVIIYFTKSAARTKVKKN